MQKLIVIFSIILLFLVSTAFAELTEADKAEVRQSADRAMDKTNIELADEIAEILYGDSLSLILMRELKEIVRHKAAVQRRYNRFSRFIPDSLSGALSIRTPTLEDAPFDFELSSEAEWDVLSVSKAFGRWCG